MPGEERGFQLNFFFCSTSQDHHLYLLRCTTKCCSCSLTRWTHQHVYHKLSLMWIQDLISVSISVSICVTWSLITWKWIQKFCGLHIGKLTLNWWQLRKKQFHSIAFDSTYQRRSRCKLLNYETRIIPSTLTDKLYLQDNLMVSPVYELTIAT